MEPIISWPPRRRETELAPIRPLRAKVAAFPERAGAIPGLRRFYFCGDDSHRNFGGKHGYINFHS
jgi:hypothetical protein